MDGTTAQAGWRGWAVDTARCLRFYTRLPVPALPFETDPHALPDFATVPRMLPVAGAVVGAVGGLVLIAGDLAGLPSMPAAGLAIAALVAATGAFHEDGLADTADGFGGGTTPERRLVIMTDSRIGSFGGAALGLALLLRVTALAAMVDHAGAGAAALAMVAVAAVSRVVGLVPVWLLANAKPDGKSAAVGRPRDDTMVVAAALATGITVLCVAPGFGTGKAIVMLLLAAATAWPLLRLSRRMIGGQTGDVAGAGQQLAEIAALMVLAAQ